MRPNPPPSFLDDPAVRTLTYTNGFPTVPEILQLARSKRVSRILSVQIYVPPSGTEMHEFGAVQLLGGLLVAPGCGHPGIAG